jgi:hypothetical protein
VREGAAGDHGWLRARLVVVGDDERDVGDALIHPRGQS